MTTLKPEKYRGYNIDFIRKYNYYTKSTMVIGRYGNFELRGISKKEVFDEIKKEIERHF